MKLITWAKQSTHRLRAYVLKHKIVSSVTAVILLFVVISAYHSIASGRQIVTYTVGIVEKGTVMSTVSGSGQVSASQQVDIKPKASGDVTAVKVKQGQSVKTGALLVQLDASDAAQAVRDANLSLRSAQISLEKVKSSGVTSLNQAQEDLTAAQDTLKKAYDDVFTAISNAFLSFPNIMAGLTEITYGTDYGRENLGYYYSLLNNYDATAQVYSGSVSTSYQAAKTAYEKNFLDYKSSNRYASNAEIDQLLTETYNAAKSLSDAVKNLDNFLSYINDKVAGQNAFIPSKLSTHRSDLATYTGQANSQLSALLNIKNTISNDKSLVENKTTTLDDLQNGSGAALDLESAQLTVVQRQSSLYNAQRNLADYSIRAPFDGVIAAVNVKKGDTVSSGTAVVTIITTQSLVDISLNEIDIVNVHQDNKATITFDAIENLSISGSVAVVDMIGTTSQGVVAYNVTVAFDTQDERIKPGMSASATIITSIKQDVLIVPSTAVKTQGTVSYVEVPGNPVAEDQIGKTIALGSTQRKVVTIGVPDDTSTEIVSGLNEGDQVIVKTTTSSSTKSSKSTQQTSSLLGGNSGGPSGGMIFPR